MAGEPVRGIGLHGEEPKRLNLSDGTRLLLDTGSADAGAVRWKRVGWRRRGGTNEISVREARDLAGEPFDAYVKRRTRSEAEWMRAVADWYRDQANRLDEALR